MPNIVLWLLVASMPTASIYSLYRGLQKWSDSAGIYLASALRLTSLFLCCCEWRCRSQARAQLHVGTSTGTCSVGHDAGAGMSLDPQMLMNTLCPALSEVLTTNLHHVECGRHIFDPSDDNIASVHASERFWP